MIGRILAAIRSAIRRAASWRLPDPYHWDAGLGHGAACKCGDCRDERVERTAW